MNKKIRISLVLLLTAVTTAGCTGGNTAKKEDATVAPSAKAAPVEFSISYVVNGNTGYAQKQPDLNKDKWILKLNELTNTIQHPRVTEQSKLPILFAGNEIPDVVGSNGTPTSKDMSGSVEAGVFQPLDDLLKQNAPNLMKAVPKAAWEAVSYKGKIYGLPTFLTNPSRRATFIRSDLLAKTGLQPPKTVDEFLNVLRAFKKLGVEHPYQGREKLKYADTILGAFDVLPYRDQFEVVNGQLQPKFFDSDNMQKALQVYKTMYDEGLMAKDFATIGPTDFLKNTRGGKAGMWSQNAIGLSDFRQSLVQVDPNGKVDIIPSPAGPEGKSGYFYYSPVTTAYYINKNVKPDKAAAIVRYFDWMVTEQGEKFFQLGIEGDTYTVENGKINYKIPKTQDDVELESFRGTIHGAHDGTASRLRFELTQDGKDTLKAMDTVTAKEGLAGIGFNPDPAAYAKYPDASFPGQDEPPKIIVDHMIKMIYGKEPITDWPKVLDEWKAKGGSEILKEVQDRYAKNEGIVKFDK